MSFTHKNMLSDWFCVSLQEIESCLSVGALSSWLKADINDDKNFNLEESWMEETSFISMPEDLM